MNSLYRTYPRRKIIHVFISWGRGISALCIFIFFSYDNWALLLANLSPVSLLWDHCYTTMVSSDNGRASLVMNDSNVYLALLPVHLHIVVSLCHMQAISWKCYCQSVIIRPKNRLMSVLRKLVLPISKIKICRSYNLRNLRYGIENKLGYIWLEVCKVKNLHGLQINKHLKNCYISTTQKSVKYNIILYRFLFFYRCVIYLPCL